MHKLTYCDWLKLKLHHCSFLLVVCKLYLSLVSRCRTEFEHAQHQWPLIYQIQTCWCSFIGAQTVLLPLSPDGPENILLKLSPLQECYAEGSNIDLKCSGDSRPSALIHWFQDGALLLGTGPHFKLVNVQTKHSGNYSCQAFNNKTLRYGTSPPVVISIFGTKTPLQIFKLAFFKKLTSFPFLFFLQRQSPMWLWHQTPHTC